MEGKEGLKQLYKVFGKKKENEDQMDSIANIFYEMGNKNELKESSEIDKDKLTKERS